MKKTNRTTKAVAAGALLLAGLGAGVALGAAGSASADAEQGYGPGTERSTGTPPDPSKSQRSDEKLLTGTTAAKVKAAALKKYPNATIERVETDSDGVYEAHIVTLSRRPRDRPGGQGLRGHRHPDRRARRRPRRPRWSGPRRR